MRVCFCSTCGCSCHCTAPAVLETAAGCAADMACNLLHTGRSAAQQALHVATASPPTHRTRTAPAVSSEHSCILITTCCQLHPHHHLLPAAARLLRTCATAASWRCCGSQSVECPGPGTAAAPPARPPPQTPTWRGCLQPSRWCCLQAARTQAAAVRPQHITPSLAQNQTMP